MIAASFTTSVCKGMLYSNAILMWNSSDIAHTATFVIYIARKLQSQDIWSLSVFGKLLETPTPPTAHFSVVNQINHLPSVRSPAAPSWCFLDMILIFIKPPLVVNQKVQVTPTAWTPPSTHMALLMPLSPLDPKKTHIPLQKQQYFLLSKMESNKSTWDPEMFIL